jgi:hypothetical protein
VSRAAETGAVVVAVDHAGAVLSPVVLPGPVVGQLVALPSTDFTELVRLLEARFTIERVLAPAAAARIASPEDVTALELVTTPEPA